MGNSSKRDTRAVDSQEVTKRILIMRRQGMALCEIAKVMGVSQQAIHQRIKKAIRAIPMMAARDVRRFELLQLDKMMLSLREKLAVGDTKAVEAGLKILERRARYLALDKQVDGMASRQAPSEIIFKFPDEISNKGDQVEAKEAGPEEN